MKSILFSLLIIPTAFAQNPDAYFPLHVGNEWVYRLGGALANNTPPSVVDIPRTENVNGVEYSVLRGLTENPVFLRVDNRGVLQMYDPRTQREEPWVDFSAATGTTFPTGVDPCNRTGRMESRDATVRVPAAEFSRALRVAYPSANCADAGLTAEAFAPYIGLVERTFTTIAGPRSLQLVYARVGGVTVISEPEVSVTLSLDRMQYTPLATLTARLTIRNTQPEPLELHFTSSQRYDMIIRDAQGNSVFTWSASRSFLQVLGTEVIANGQRTWVITAPVSFPEGSYVAEAWLTTEGGKRYAAQAAFRVVSPPRP